MNRWSIWIEGIVQGVGFRPFVHELATRYKLTGSVRNEGDGVRIEVEGNQAEVERFRADLSMRAPCGARIVTALAREIPATGDREFAIEPSRDLSSGLSFAPADTATCAECLAELFDSTDRRYRYPFTSCAHCGPRFTVISSLPYDRERTTMAAFPLCAECQCEYDDLAGRRFHAQSIACPACGPRLSLLDASGIPRRDPDLLAAAVVALGLGGIVAFKGLGGFHLACDATRADTVAELRRRKHRDQKPLAVMADSL